MNKVFAQFDKERNELEAWLIAQDGVKELTGAENNKIYAIMDDVEGSFGDDCDVTGMINELTDSTIYLTFEFEDGGSDHNVTVDRKTMKIIKE